MSIGLWIDIYDGDIYESKIRVKNHEKICLYVIELKNRYAKEICYRFVKLKLE